MKRLFFLFFILIALWLGATGYIGGQTGPQLQRYFQDLNRRFADQMGVQYYLKPVKKGFFVSTYSLEVNTTLPLHAEPLRAFPSELRRVRLNVEHGPLFFLHGLGIGLARITSAQSFKPYRKVLAPAGIVLEPETGTFRTYATVSFARQLHFMAQGDAFAFIDTEHNTSTHIAPVALTADIDPWTYVGDYHMKTSSIELTALRRKEPVFRLKDLRLSGHIDAMLRGMFFLGDVTMEAAHMQIYPPKKDPIDLTPRFVFALRSEENGTVGLDCSSQMRVLSGTLPDSAAPIVSAEGALRLGGLSRKGLESFYGKIHRLQSDQMHLYHTMMSQQNTPETMAKSLVKLQRLQQKIQEVMILSLGEVFLPGRSTLSLHLTLATRRNPDNRADATLRLIGAFPKGDTRAIQRTLLTGFPELFTLDAEARLGKTFLQEFGPEGIRAHAMLALPIREGFVRDEKRAFVSSIRYTPRSLTINHKSMPQLLMVLKMLLGGRGQK